VNDDTADVDRLFARLSGEAPHRDPDDHPAPEKLSAYLASELPPEEDNEIQEHLAHCTLCTELLLDLQRFLEPPAEDLPREGVVDFETAAGWRELRGRMGEEGAREASKPPGRMRKIFGSLKVAYGLAAVLALTVVGLTLHTMTARQELSPADAESVFLPSSMGVRGEGLEKTIEFRSGQKGNVPLVFDAPEDSFPKYRMEIRRSNGKEPLRLEDIQRSSEGDLAWKLSPDTLADGHYAVEVQGIGTGAPVTLGTYRLKVIHH
jgi:hypothetical protein